MIAANVVAIKQTAPKAMPMRERLIADRLNISAFDCEVVRTYIDAISVVREIAKITMAGIKAVLAQ